MELCAVPHRKRYCVENTELLRVILAFPEAGGEHEYDGLNAFYGELAARTLRFAEDGLFPYCKGVYDALPDHDRKFRPPKWIYRVEAECEAPTDASLRVTLRILLQRKGGESFEAREVQHWAMRDGGYVMIPPPRETGKRLSETGENLNKN